ncbi:hypothetical protein SLEP1_g27759 [Rubroshorea leprosula]|uniref:Uncharacterized protein n=1 Tax=Rubroshorea leprosula TaxID=152421 RepID=A0AAV5JX04_9ROSI|nr:hypothetical protein SLEP1_g27759 [Rubroshorea leprosula]
MPTWIFLVISEIGIDCEIRLLLGVVNTGTITDACQWELLNTGTSVTLPMGLNIGNYCARQWEVYKRWP